MASVLVRKVSEETVDLLKQRAAKNKRSLQAELSAILEQAGRDVRVRNALEFLEEFHRQHPNVRKSGGPVSVEMIREDRDTDHGHDW
jgi:plasmid stability protein